MIGTHTDITPRKQAELALRKAEDQLRQSQKLEAVGTLAGGIAHDFNNIVMGIYGFTELARKASRGNDEALDYIDEISNAAQRARDLVRQILAFSRAETQPLESVELNHIVVEALSLLRATMPQNLELEVEVPDTLPAIQGNSTQLHQVIVNLCTNAIHAMADKPGKLHVILDQRKLDTEQVREFNRCSPGPYLCLTVSDTGQGMSAETKARVFEPFFTTKDPGKGTGLGLSVVHGIIQNHGGGIRISSQLDHGTSIEIYLPDRRVEAVKPSEESKLELRGRGERILCVDDDPAILRSSVITLKGLGYDVIGESSSTKALRLIQDDPDTFHLLITDQIMPSMTGLELASQVHSLRPALPVIIASGYSNELNSEQIQASGVKEIIYKPHTNQEMAAAIKRCLKT